MQYGSFCGPNYMVGFLIHAAALVSLHASCSLVCFTLMFVGNTLHSSSIHLDTPNGFVFFFAYLALKFITHIWANWAIFDLDFPHLTFWNPFYSELQINSLN